MDVEAADDGVGTRRGGGENEDEKSSRKGNGGDDDDDPAFRTIMAGRPDPSIVRSEEVASAASAATSSSSSAGGGSDGDGTDDTDRSSPPAMKGPATVPVVTSRSSKKRYVGGGSSSSRGASPVPPPVASSSSVAAGGGAGAAGASSSTKSAALAALASASHLLQLTGLQGLLTGPGGLAASSSSSSSASAATAKTPSIDAVRSAALRAMNDCPPHVHLSSRDVAPQLKIDDGPVGRRLSCRGMRGYRMARATHGVSSGCYYYECLVLDPPGAREIATSLPPNARLGPKVKEALQTRLVHEEKEERRKKELDEQMKREGKEGDTADLGTNSEGQQKHLPPKKKRRIATADSSDPSSSATASSRPTPQGGHVRIGWSMRTGDLQAPVGYDRWSYGLRDVSGSRIHDSRREDRWGGEPFGPGDYVGFAVCLVGGESSAGGTGSSDGVGEDSGGGSSGGGGGVGRSQPPPQTNHIRFFKNGDPMGHFVISQGKRSGGAAFEDIIPGTYYPAVSCYMGGSIKINFGPYFVYPPRSLPSGMKVKPVSELCPPPPEPDEAVRKACQTRDAKAFLRSGRAANDDGALVSSFKNCVWVEAQVRHDAYQNHAARHVEEVREERTVRGLSTSDLPAPPKEEEGEGGREADGGEGGQSIGGDAIEEKDK